MASVRPWGKHSPLAASGPRAREREGYSWAAGAAILKRTARRPISGAPPELVSGIGDVNDVL